MEGDQTREGKMPEIEKFVEFWGGLWERNARTLNIPLMKEMRRLLGETVINEFDIDTKKLKKEINKRKSWTVPGINGVQNFWWKKLVPVQKALSSEFKRIKSVVITPIVLGWWTTGKTVLLSKTKDLSDEKNYRPRTCLNTKY